MRRKIVVTGGAGFIGSHLVNALVGLGHRVVVVDNLVSGKAENVHKAAELCIRDIRDVKSIRSAFVRADTVFHLAALPRVQLSIEKPLETGAVNINGTMNVLVAAQDAKVRRFVFASSSSVYGDPAVLPAHEELVPSPLSPYAMHKHVGEVMCRIWNGIYGLQTLPLRLFNVYGPGFDPNGPYALVIGKFITQRLRGEPMTICGDGEQSRDFTHVTDVVRAFLSAMDCPEYNAHGNPINIGCGSPATVNRIAELIGGPVAMCSPRSGEPRRTHADITKAQRILGWTPRVSIEQGIAMLKESTGL
jgi:UDP-glucose 4-epimerase